MADNIVLNTGSGGDTAGADDIGGVKFQRIKLIHGADGTNDGDVSSVNPLPINYTKSATVIDTYTTPLGIGGSYTSPALDHSINGAYVTHFIFANVDGTHYAEESAHGSTNWQIVDTEAVTGGTVLRESHQSVARYSRARFVNGGTAQATFIHQVIQKHIGQDEYIKISDSQNTVDTELPAAAALGDGVGNPTTPMIGACVLVYNGSTYSRVGGDAASGMEIQVLGWDAGVIALIQGANAHDAATSGNPILGGGNASAAFPSEVSADGDAVKNWSDRIGRQIVSPHAPPNVASATRGPSYVTLTTTSNVAIVAAPGAGQSIYVTEIMAGNASAVLTKLLLKDGTSTKMQQVLAASGGGFVFKFDPAWKITANTALNGALSVGVTDVDVSVHFFVAP